MEEITGPGAGLKYGYPLRANTWGPGYNRSMRLLDWIAMPTVLAGVSQTPPASPQPGEAYFTGAAPTGAWAGHPDVIALRTDDADEPWFFLPPQPGWVVNVYDATGATLTPMAWDGTQWFVYNGGGTASYPVAFGESTEADPVATEANSAALAKGAAIAWPGDIALGVNATTEVGSRSNWEPEPGLFPEQVSSLALGYGAVASAMNAVALGSQSVADTDDTISVGISGANPNEPERVRRIVNVNYAENLFDAVPLGQLKDLGGSFSTSLQGSTAEYGPYATQSILTSSEGGALQSFSFLSEDLPVGHRLRAIAYRVIQAHPSVTALNVGMFPESDAAEWSNNLTNVEGPIPFTAGAEGVYVLDKPAVAGLQLHRLVLCTQDAAANFPKGVNLYTMALILFFERFDVAWAA